ncbi:MAG TPA: 16S rRNA (uracil(1498)-N(3))-methyltransferase [Pyrinomonadaceae bacterium]|nr:16S rRNA (uracil(1498)-N(3))-methyltransferase [Pyrinomonadaceae bacterium]
MTRRRFFAPPGAFTAKRDSVSLLGDEARYLREVLRLRVGDSVFVFNGQGKEFQCEIEESRRESARLKVVSEVIPTKPESPLALTLAIALLKGEKFDLAVQKATELGVTRIVPVTTKLADVRLRDEGDADKRGARWQRIAVEAAKQSGRAVVPPVDRPVAFSSLLSSSSCAEGDACLLFSERGGENLSETMNKLPPGRSRLTAVVGSEGGWTDEEIATARAAGWHIVTLGGRTLRAETAAITVTSLLQHLFGDLT